MGSDVTIKKKKKNNIIPIATINRDLTVEEIDALRVVIMHGDLES